MGGVKLAYKGKESFEKQDAQKFITLASKRLATEVFTNEINNSLLLLLFTSSETFLPLETEALRKKVDNSLVFTVEFCALLKERADDDIVPALNQLLNLNDRNLVNYEKKIREIFRTLLPMELLVVDVPDLTNLPDVRDVPDLKNVPDKKDRRGYISQYFK
ncbi:hypothetical protein Ocin01_10023 [Orchesella cincta]|uniref:Uncharacterized protein n=1 Tax=Orchesella cincta TaxID=48709 RepID=A0A1D2MU75_ORCCI|nr:hypothetical protein Ocin01_10023 [Orchesella cincta]